ncbi:MAG: LysM peptidoglycan-binding domain-containing protein [Anaerolineales bacterium]
MNRILRIQPWIHLAMSLSLLIGLIVNPAPAMAQSETGEAHIVQAGETLYSLSRRYGVSVQRLSEANGLPVNTWLYVGQRLTIPGLAPGPAPPAEDNAYIVRPGDTLISIAARNNISASALASANGLSLTSWVYVGQRLTIPGQQADPPPPTPGGAHTVQRGDTLFSIARRHGTTVAALRAANGLGSNLIYVGQELTIPDGDAPVDATPTPPSPPPPPSETRSGKWIDVNLSTQTVTAYEGQTPVYTALASTGTQWTPTVVGAYEIYVKYVSTTMSGPGYYLPNVPYTMYFYKGYGLHGTYWHSNFGTPMSHGCVNLATPDAEWFYNWAPIGTPVVSHY